MQISIVSEEKLNLEEVVESTNDKKALANIDTLNEYVEIKRLQKLIDIQNKEIGELRNRIKRLERRA